MTLANNVLVALSADECAKRKKARSPARRRQGPDLTLQNEEFRMKGHRMPREFLPVPRMHLQSAARLE